MKFIHFRGLCFSYYLLFDVSMFGYFLQKFIEQDYLLQNISPETPLYIIMEGSEPQFFTRFFSWDSSKTAVRILISLNLFCIVN